jgi:hypothetical protein
MAKWQKIDEADYLKGLNDVMNEIQEEIDKLQTKSEEGLKNALLFVATESQNKAPVEFGDLRGSVLVEMDGNVVAEGNEQGGLSIVGNASGTAGSVSYNTPYAATQHEHTEFDHPLGGQAKYLESVLTSEKDRILQFIAGELEG